MVCRANLTRQPQEKIENVGKRFKKPVVTTAGVPFGSRNHCKAANKCSVPFYRFRITAVLSKDRNIQSFCGDFIEFWAFFL